MPCGPNSQCRNRNGQAVCTCVPGFLGSPPNCRPECILSSDCLLNQACSNQKCIDPCPGTCGINAICRVVNHNPICSCKEDLTGDPFTLCRPLREYQIDFISITQIRCHYHYYYIFLQQLLRNNQKILVYLLLAVQTRNVKL